jgi:chromosome segregation ATPase
MEEINQVPDLQAQEDKLASTIQGEQSRLESLRTRHQELIDSAQACGPEATADEIREAIDRILEEERELSALLVADQEQEAELRKRLESFPEKKPELEN